MCYWAVHYSNADCQDQAATLPFILHLAPFYMHVCKETLQGVSGTIGIFNSLNLQYFFNEVQMYGFLDLPTQKTLIWKISKIFHTGSRYKTIPLFHREMKISSLKKQQKEGGGAADFSLQFPQSHGKGFTKLKERKHFITFTVLSFWVHFIKHPGWA